ncbi:MAG: PEP-utilizing enzyme, partial [Microcoleus sp.]
GLGSVSGLARVARSAADVGNFRSGEILVVENTSADFVDMIRKAGGVVTEEDSLTSHAAIIGLRLGIPVMVGVKNAMRVIRDGTMLTLDMQRGLVYSGARGGGPDAELAV